MENLLAESYKWLDDTTLEIHLNPAARFSNGDPVTPEDVLWSMQYYIESGSNLSTYYTNYDYDNCEIVDDTTFILKYFEPYGPAINYLTLMKVQNKSYYEEFGEDAYWDSPCGSGPYEVVENVSGSHTTYRLREDYWNPDMMPEVKEFVVKSYPEKSTMYIDFENGDLDIAWNIDDSDAQRALDSGSGYLKENAALLVRGRISLRDEKEPQITVDSIRPLSDLDGVRSAPEESKKERKLYVKVASTDKKALRRIDLLLEMFPGREQLVEFHPDLGKTRSASCAIHPALIEELRETLGEACGIEVKTASAGIRK